MFSTRFHIVRSGARSISGIQRLRNNKQSTENLFTKSVNVISTDRHWLKSPVKFFSTEQFAAPSDPDVFGGIGGREFEKLELDEDEAELEEFEMNESRVPRSLKLTPAQYVYEIKKCIKNRDLESAMKVLDAVKQNRDKPTTYMLNFLIRAYAEQGDLRMCFKLFTMMKKLRLQANAATYTSMLNVCANSNKTEKALEALSNLRQELIEKNIVLNDTHYNAMVKAYGKHKCTLEAFQMVDEMVDKKIKFGEATMNSLFFAAISDKKNGLRHALIVWHLMQKRRIKPSLMTYNLLLRAIRDTKLGNLKINDCLLENIDGSRILLSDGTNPDLLAYPPIVSKLAIDSLYPREDKKQKEYKSSAAANLYDNNDDEIEPLPTPQNINLSDIHERNRLILFGGFNGFLERMARDNVVPNAKTITLLMEIVPNSLSIENTLIQTARERKIPLDIDFFNMLIKKRSFRKEYLHAKKVLDEIQLSGLQPNVITWGVLALGCKTRADAYALLEGMEATGHTLNPVIAGSLIGNACSQNSFLYVLEVMNLMSTLRVKPSEEIYTMLDNFKKKITDIVLKKVDSKHSNNPRYKELLSKFNLRYSSFQEQFGRVKKRNYNERES